MASAYVDQQYQNISKPETVGKGKSIPLNREIPVAKGGRKDDWGAIIQLQQDQHRMNE